MTARPERCTGCNRHAIANCASAIRSPDLQSTDCQRRSCRIVNFDEFIRRPTRTAGAEFANQQLTGRRFDGERGGRAAHGVQAVGGRRRDLSRTRHVTADGSSR